MNEPHNGFFLIGALAGVESLGLKVSPMELG